MNTQALWVTAPPSVPIALGLGDGLCFDQVERVDWSQAVQRLAVPSPTTDTLWVLHCSAQGPSPENLRQALRGVMRPLRVLVLPLVAHGHPQVAAWLDAGADRCLPSPCPPELLVAMLCALRRSAVHGGQRVSHFAGLRFDHEAMSLHGGEQRIALTQREAELMSLLIRRVGKWVTNREILTHMAKGAASVLRPAAVQLYVHRVNKKIAAHGLHVDCVKRVGYGLVVRPAATQQAAAEACVWPALCAHRPFANQALQARNPGGL